MTDSFDPGATQFGRSLGVDFGSKRVGIAVADARGVLASPLTVLERTGSIERDHARIGALAEEEEAVRIVVGLPIALDGTHSIAAEAVMSEVDQLTKAVSVPVVTWDERLTSAAAHKGLKAQNLSEKKRRGQIDKWAAAVMLQGWLDSRQNEPVQR